MAAAPHGPQGSALAPAAARAGRRGSWQVTCGGPHSVTTVLTWGLWQQAGDLAGHTLPLEGSRNGPPRAGQAALTSVSPESLVPYAVFWGHSLGVLLSPWPLACGSQQQGRSEGTLHPFVPTPRSVPLRIRDGADAPTCVPVSDLSSVTCLLSSYLG